MHNNFIIIFTVEYFELLYCIKYGIPYFQQIQLSVYLKLSGIYNCLILSKVITESKHCLPLCI